VEAERLKAAPSLKMVNVMENPLSLRSIEILASITAITVLLTPPEPDEDEDDWDSEDLKETS